MLGFKCPKNSQKMPLKNAFKLYLLKIGKKIKIILQ
jgi:hypothetical protein